MKALIALGVLQTVGIAVLIVHALGAARFAAPELQPSSASAAAISPVPSAATSGTASSFGEERLRAIVREELARLEPGGQGSSRTSMGAQPRNPIVDVRQYEAVAQQIDSYRGAGAITDAQMQELQADIAQLDEESRRQMMSKLIRALNAGEIKGRL